MNVIQTYYIRRRRWIKCGHVIQTKSFVDVCTKKMYSIRSFINCKSTYVIYRLQCPCSCFYVGQTKRRLQDRLWEHKKTIRTRNKDYPVAVHYASVHDSNPSTLKTIGLETVTGSIRKGDRLQRLLQREAFWIFQLRATIFPGLNEELDLNIFCETLLV